MKEQLELVRFLIQPHSLTNFEKEKHYQNERKINCVYARNNISKTKNGAYVVNLDEYKSIGTHLFWQLKDEHIPKEIRKFISNKNITTNIYRILVNNSIMCGYFRTGFIDFKLKSKSLLDYINAFSPNEYNEW